MTDETTPKPPLSSFGKISENSDLSARGSRRFNAEKKSSSSETSQSQLKMDAVKRIFRSSEIDTESRVIKFLSKVNNFFVEIFIGVPNPEIEVKLAGRIHEFQKDIKKIVDHLQALRQELEVEHQFSALVSCVIDPLIKEINRLGKVGYSTTAEHVRELKDYSDWMDKAKKWINLCSRRQNQADAINQAIIDYIFSEFHARIDRDLQVIQDYLNHCMNGLNANDLEKMELKDQLELELSQHIFELYLLKDHPKNKTLDDLNAWRSEADVARENHFSAALHTIDSNIGKLAPPTVIEESHDRNTVEIETRLSSLEEKIFRLREDIREFEYGRDEEVKKMCLSNLAKMEDEAHALNSNLQLTHDNVERVQQVLESISYFYSLLKV